MFFIIWTNLGDQIRQVNNDHREVDIIKMNPLDKEENGEMLYLTDIYIYFCVDTSRTI